MYRHENGGVTEELSIGQIERAFQMALDLPASGGMRWKFYLAHPKSRKAIVVYFPEQSEFLCFPNFEGETEHLVTSDPRAGAEFLYREHRPQCLSLHVFGELLPVTAHA